MAIQGTQSDVFQQFGFSYFQLVDYSSKQFTATCVQVSILVWMTWDCINTFDGEMAFFWEARRELRWSIARVLFIVNRRLPIIAFSLQAYWRINRSLDNPLCSVKHSLSYVMAPVYITTGILQTLRVWSLYNRSRRVGYLLLALVACQIIGTSLARSLPTPRGVFVLKLAPESLTGCGPERAKGFFMCLSALTLETILLAMIIFKVQRSWRHVGPMPLFRALVVDGATYYLIFILAFVLELIANASDVLYYPIVDTNSVISVSVVACNHLMLSLREVAGRPAASELLSSRPPTAVLFTPQASGATDSYDDQSQTIPLAEHLRSARWDHKQSNLEQKPGTWNEIPSSRGSTARVSFE